MLLPLLKNDVLLRCRRPTHRHYTCTYACVVTCGARPPRLDSLGLPFEKRVRIDFYPPNLSQRALCVIAGNPGLHVYCTNL
jgi:hypothetical protein